MDYGENHPLLQKEKNRLKLEMLKNGIRGNR